MNLSPTDPRVLIFMACMGVTLMGVLTAVWRSRRK